MLKWLATQFERRRGALQARLENRLRETVSGTPARIRSTELRQQGNAFLGEGNLSEAERCYREAISADPKDASCHSALGYVLYESGRRADAEAALERAVRLDQIDFDAYYLLGNISRDRQELLRAIVCYRTALRLKPDFDFCRRELCVALARNGMIEDAQQVMDEGPGFDENSANYHFFKGNLHSAKDRVGDALVCFQTAAELSPNDVSILWNLCTAQLQQRDVFGAIQTAQRMLELEPDHATAYSLLATAHQNLCRYDESVRYYRQSLDLEPNGLATHRNLLFSLTYIPDYPPQDYLAEARRFGEKVRAMARPYDQWQAPPKGKRSGPLRVGFVSADLHFHPVGLFLLNIVRELDTQRITCIAYSNRTEEDAFTALLRPHFVEWNVVATLDDAALARKIHDDRIDILVDLGGHSGQSRVAVFAWCAAPVQVTWLGYWASTGLVEIDYLLADPHCFHAEEAPNFSERVWLLPDTRLCMQPPPADELQNLSPGPVPCLDKGFVTFGSFQNVTKITDASLAVWSKILTRLPSARLRLQTHVFQFPESVDYMKKRLLAAQIDLARVDLVAGTGWLNYMAAYREVDIVLDTIPFPGGTTTAEALWMGVPTITLSGNTMVSRQGVSMLRCVGLDDWVAHDQGEYVRLAQEKVVATAALSILRTELRARALASPLFDGPRFAKNLEIAFEGMYAQKSGCAPNVNPK